MTQVFIVTARGGYASGWVLGAFSDRVSAQAAIQERCDAWTKAMEITPEDRAAGDAYCEESATEWRVRGNPPGVDMVEHCLSHEQRQSQYEFNACRRAIEQMWEEGEPECDADFDRIPSYKIEEFEIR